jgi:alpha-L-fucosidase/beta-xylosidase
VKTENGIYIFLLLMTAIDGNSVAQDAGKKYEPDFASLEKSNPVPEWFKDAKFGIYFHWGVYSVPAFANEWYPRNMYRKGSPENKHHNAVYGDPNTWPYHNFIIGAKDKEGNFVQFAPKLKSAGGRFDPGEWAQLFSDAGAKFAGPVAEHHDGFSMWASQANPWNAKDMGPRLDLVGLLTDAIRKKNMKVILSMHHAFNITGFYDSVPKMSDEKLQTLYGQQGKEKNEALWLNKHKEIIDNYQPDIIWQDFNLHKISPRVLLGFLAYYYNKALEWKKEVVATYKDGLNTKCAVLDYERGGPTDITANYWLTDDAISSSSWCYTEGIGYYSKKQVLHGFLDRISKNGNLLLNISPRADGSIPEEQKDILLSMGAWLKKYGEAVYATRAWEKYGEGPTKMGAAHGVFTAPAEGTAKDVRYTRSKDNTTLYAILLGWEKDQKEIILSSLSKELMDGKSIAAVELINGAGNYQPLTFIQGSVGLIVRLPARSTEELAYVLRLRFNGKIPALNTQKAKNPIIFADVPDMSMVRVGNNWFMTSTTMHMSPGVPVMKSTDLVNWKIVSYAYDTLANLDALNLTNGKSTYGRGSWASCIRYHKGTYYVTTFAQTTGKTHVYTTKDIEKGPWKAVSFSPSLHDHSLFFDDDGKVYMLYGNGRLTLVELNDDVSGIKPGGLNQVVIENASAPAGSNIMLGAEGSQLYKINGKYYLFNITWPRGGMRTVVVHRADKITGPYEGKVALQDLGVAQGGLIDMPDGRWFAYLFRDYGSVGRIPYLVPVKWEDGWPVLGENGKVPVTLDLPAGKGLIPGIVAPDEFVRKKGEPALPLVWQWNHNPDNKLWSVRSRKGFLRLTTGRIDTNFLNARNTLTQRTFGPVCAGSTLLDVSHMKDGDFAGLALLQKNYGIAGVKVNGISRFLVMINAGSGKPEEVANIPLTQNTIYLRAECDFTDKKDIANFFYSLDGKTWKPFGTPLKMTYTLPQHFMGYRFALFNFAAKNTGGSADFDFFHIEDAINNKQ